MRIQGYCITAWTLSYRLILHLTQVFSTSRVMAGHTDRLSDSSAPGRGPDYTALPIHPGEHNCQRKHSDHSLGVANWANMEESKQTQDIHSNIRMPLHGTNISMNNLQKKSPFGRQGRKELSFSLRSCGKAKEISEKPFTVNYSGLSFQQTQSSSQSI